MEKEKKPAPEPKPKPAWTRPTLEEVRMTGHFMLCGKNKGQCPTSPRNAGECF